MATKVRKSAPPAIEPSALYTYEEAAHHLSTTRHGIKHLVGIGWLGYTPVSPNGRLRRISGQQILDYQRRHAVDPSGEAA